MSSRPPRPKKSARPRPIPETPAFSEIPADYDGKTRSGLWIVLLTLPAADQVGELWAIGYSKTDAAEARQAAEARLFEAWARSHGGQA